MSGPRGSRRRRTPLAAILATVALTTVGCGAASTAAVPPVRAPVVLPGGASAYAAGAPAGSADSCGGVPVEASRPALPAVPPPGAMPTGSYEAAIYQRGYLIAGVDQNTYLFGYRDPATGALSGFDIDMLHQVSQAIFGDPNKIRFVVVANADRVSAAQTGRVDVVAETMTITCSRKQSVAFSTVYFEAGQRILVPNGSRISGSTGLAGQRVCAPAGSTSLTNLAALPVSPKPTLTQVANQSDCLVLLQQDQVDAISTDDTILDGFAAQDPNVGLVGPAFTKEPYGMAMSRAHPEFTAFVNAVLAAERANGTWASIYSRWLGPFDGGKVPAPPVASYNPGG
ncbi:MAG: glutamate ABC transporter substrate-binding protein [Actinomycetota bacterium]|nr:glutamate ABC transporter substrate-binding protein [Actinomycetota bacterium]